MEIRTFGVGLRMEECRRLIAEREESFPFRHLFILPIPSTRDKKTITGTDVDLEELCSLVGGEDAVAGYGIPENIKEELAMKGALIYDGAEDEELLRRNAEVTARGALGYILTNTNRDVSDMRIGIVGYGRIGSCLLRYLLFLGAEVSVYTTRESVAKELCESGVDATSASFDLERLDVLVNTAPARLFSDKHARSFMEGGRIIDLASGKIFPDAEGLVKLSSVPEKAYPITAGKIYAEHIAKYFSTEGGLC